MSLVFGACNEYRRTINDFSKIARQLNGYLEEDIELDLLDFTTEAINTLNILKYEPVDPPVLALPQPQRPCLIDTDASAYALGVVLSKQQNDSNLN